MAKAIAILGAFLLCTLAGFRFSACYTRRVRALSAMEAGVGRMLTALSYSRLPLREIAARPVYAEAQPMFDAFADGLSAGQTAAQAWSGALERCAAEEALFAALSESDRALIAGFGTSVGTTDCASQRESGEAFLAGLREAAAQAAQNAGKGRVVRTLGVLAGAAAVILLI